MAYEKQTFEDGQVLEAKHLNHMEDGIEEANKAIVSVGSDTLTWDGNTEGLPFVDLGDMKIYKVSDLTPSAEFFANGLVITTSAEAGNQTGALPPELIGNVDGLLIVMGGAFAVCPENMVGVDVDGMVFPEAGIYLGSSDYFTVTAVTIPGYTGFEVKFINPDYMKANVFYLDATEFDGTIYLYSDIALTTKATRAQIVAALENNKLSCFAVRDGLAGAFVSVAYAITQNSYCTVFFIGNVNNGVPQCFKAYTAEYTPSA